MKVQKDILDQINGVLDRYDILRRRSQFSDCSDQPESEVTALAALMCDCIGRIAPTDSQYSKSMQKLVDAYGVTNAYIIPHLVGVLAALKIAHESGYLGTISELIHADVFADFVEMAEYLLSEGYKDPAAVIVGSVLEEHLRKLAIKNGIPVDAVGKTKKADQLNSDLAAQAVYTKLDQKSVTSWLDLRNKAAHGKYDEYSNEQVRLQLQGIRDFMVRIPA